MSVPNISSNETVKIQNAHTTVRQNTVAVNNPAQYNLQRQPLEDNYNGKSNKKKILTYASVAAVLATLAGIAIDFKVSEGRHVKKLWNNLTGHKPDIEPKTDKAPNIGHKADTPDVVPSKSDSFHILRSMKPG